MQLPGKRAAAAAWSGSASRTKDDDATSSLRNDALLVEALLLLQGRSHVSNA
jgi:hypothetical protein